MVSASWFKYIFAGNPCFPGGEGGGPAAGRAVVVGEMGGRSSART